MASPKKEINDQKEEIRGGGMTAVESVEDTLRGEISSLNAQLREVKREADEYKGLYNSGVKSQLQNQKSAEAERVLQDNVNQLRSEVESLRREKESLSEQLQNKDNATKMQLDSKDKLINAVWEYSTKMRKNYEALVRSLQGVTDLAADNYLNIEEIGKRFGGE